MPMPRRLTANKSPVPARPSSPNCIISSSRSRLERRPHLLLLLAGLWLLQLAASRGVQAFPSPLSEAMTSHSGPTNALWGHEKLVPEEEMRKRTKRQVYFGGYGGWRSPALMSAAAPDGYQQMWITSEHNRYRRMVPATNMRMIYWSEELARSAQAHANTCDFRHSRNRVNIGENIWAAPYYNYSDAIYRWYSEVNNPWCGCSTGYKHCCGHYIQLVWAQTNLIGCGYAQCNGVVGVGGYGRAVFVCHYNPQGNKVMYTGSGELYAFPAYNWARAETERCSQCPPDQPACHEGLCYMPLNYQAPAVTQVANNSVTDAVATAAPTVAPYVAPYYPPAVAVQQQPAQQPVTNYSQQQNYAPNNYAQQQQQQQQQQSTLDTQLETNKIDRRRMMRRRMMAMYY